MVVGAAAGPGLVTLINRAVDALASAGDAVGGSAGDVGVRRALLSASDGEGSDGGAGGSVLSGSLKAAALKAVAFGAGAGLALGLLVALLFACGRPLLACGLRCAASAYRCLCCLSCGGDAEAKAEARAEAEAAKAAVEAARLAYPEQVNTQRRVTTSVDRFLLLPGNGSTNHSICIAILITKPLTTTTTSTHNHFNQHLLRLPTRIPPPTTRKKKKQVKAREAKLAEFDEALAALAAHGARGPFERWRTVKLARTSGFAMLCARSAACLPYMQLRDLLQGKKLADAFLTLQLPCSSSSPLPSSSSSSSSRCCNNVASLVACLVVAGHVASAVAIISGHMPSKEIAQKVTDCRKR